MSDDRVDVHVEPGGEKYVKWAKGRLSALRSTRRDLRLPALSKAYKPSGDVTVLVKSSDFGDSVRIQAGSPLGVGFYYRPPESIASLVSAEVQQGGKGKKFKPEDFLIRQRAAMLLSLPSASIHDEPLTFSPDLLVYDAASNTLFGSTYAYIREGVSVVEHSRFEDGLELVGMYGTEDGAVFFYSPESVLLSPTSAVYGYAVDINGNLTSHTSTINNFLSSYTSNIGLSTLEEGFGGFLYCNYPIPGTSNSVQDFPAALFVSDRIYLSIYYIVADDTSFFSVDGTDYVLHILTKRSTNVILRISPELEATVVAEDHAEFLYENIFRLDGSYVAEGTPLLGGQILNFSFFDVRSDYGALISTVTGVTPGLIDAGASVDTWVTRDSTYTNEYKFYEAGAIRATISDETGDQSDVTVLQRFEDGGVTFRRTTLVASGDEFTHRAIKTYYSAPGSTEAILIDDAGVVLSDFTSSFSFLLNDRETVLRVNHSSDGDHPPISVRRSGSEVTTLPPASSGSVLWDVPMFVETKTSNSRVVYYSPVGQEGTPRLHKFTIRESNNVWSYADEEMPELKPFTLESDQTHQLVAVENMFAPYGTTRVNITLGFVVP